jgi:hypothetical protein
MRYVPNEEGALFAVPLDAGGYAIGLVSRADGKGTLVAYFFGPRRGEIPRLEDLAALSRADAVTIRRCGDLHLGDQRWPVIGRLPGWSREKWPIPTFGREDPLLDDVVWQLEYSDADIIRPARQARLAQNEGGTLPPDGILGGRAVELVLDQLLPLDG